MWLAVSEVLQGNETLLLNILIALNIKYLIAYCYQTQCMISNFS